jgi:hypothetical protein
MDAAVRFSSRSFPVRVALFAFLIAAFFIFLGLFSRAFIHYDVAIASINDPTGTARLMQELERLDADYRIRKDGSILIDNADTQRLRHEGIVFADVPVGLYRLPQILTALLSAVTAILIFFVGRNIAAQLKKANAKPFASATIHTDTGFSTSRGEASESLSPDRGKVRMQSRLFEAEHPQTLAVYMLGLETEEAAFAMQTMPPLLRDEIWKRMLGSGECTAVLRRKISGLFDEKMKRLRKQSRPDEVTDKMVAIFRQLSPQTRNELLAVSRGKDAEDVLIALLEAENRIGTGRKEA